MSYAIRRNEHGLPCLDVPTLVDCGCTTTVWQDGSGVEISWCPLHGAAPDLLNACNLLMGRLQHLEPYLEYQRVQRKLNAEALAIAEAAINAAEGH